MSDQEQKVDVVKSHHPLLQLIKFKNQRNYHDIGTLKMMFFGRSLRGKRFKGSFLCDNFHCTKQNPKHCLFSGCECVVLLATRTEADM